jgi:hypothetical protein
MSDYPGPGGEQDAVQPPPGQPYPQSAPTQLNPQINPPPWQDQQQQGQQYGQQPPYGQQQYGQQPPPGFPQAPPVPAGYGYGQPGGQPVPAGMYLDQESGLMLPQGTVLASPGRRIGAFFLAIPLVIITLGIGYVVWGLIVWGNGPPDAGDALLPARDQPCRGLLVDGPARDRRPHPRGHPVHHHPADLADLHADQA